MDIGAVYEPPIHRRHLAIDDRGVRLSARGTTIVDPYRVLEQPESGCRSASAAVRRYTYAVKRSQKDAPHIPPTAGVGSPNLPIRGRPWFASTESGVAVRLASSSTPGV